MPYIIPYTKHHKDDWLNIKHPNSLDESNVWIVQFPFTQNMSFENKPEGYHVYEIKKLDSRHIM